MLVRVGIYLIVSIHIILCEIRIKMHTFDCSRKHVTKEIVQKRKSLDQYHLTASQIHSEMPEQKPVIKMIGRYYLQTRCRSRRKSPITDS